MKKILFVLVAMLTVLSVDAQIVTSRSRSVKTKVSDNYTRIYAGYTNFGASEGDGAHGVDFGFLKGINVASIPLYVEVGGELGWNTSTGYVYEGKHLVEKDWHVFNVSMPVSLSYKFELSDNISLMPFTGPNFRFNVYDSIAEGDQAIFQAGWNVGAGFTFGQFYVGYRFTANFNSYNGNGGDAGMVNAAHIGYQF